MTDHQNFTVRWVKSTRSNDSYECVEVADLANGHRAVRDSKNPDGGYLTFTPTGWAAFIDGAKVGEFD